MTIPASVWVSGTTRTGKTTRLVEQFSVFLQSGLDIPEKRSVPVPKKRGSSSVEAGLRQTNLQQTAGAILVFAANGDNRLELTDRILAAIQERYPVRSTTPLAFFENEVTLFFPLVAQQLGLNTQFPIRLRPENEQELATRLWRSALTPEVLDQAGVGEYRLVRRILDLMQLAAFGGIPIADITILLEQGLPEQEPLWGLVGRLALEWRSWCLDRGLLTYGILTELYWRDLLPHATYQQYLTQRYRGVLADDVDEYPAIVRDVFEQLLDSGAAGLFTHNPNGGIRQGLGADPAYWAGLATRCAVETLTHCPGGCLADTVGEAVVELVSNPIFLFQLPEPMRSIQETSRAQILRRTAEVIIQAVQDEQIQPQDIAVIAPGLDAIARYTLTEILAAKGIASEPLNDQRPLVSSPMVRALLTLLALVYPGLGRSIDREAIAEMLVILSQKPEIPTPSFPHSPTPPLLHSSTAIDPVRAGLLADYCFEPHPDRPRLLPVTAFPRWDRLGYQATTAYEGILQWLEVQQLQQSQRLILTPLTILDRAIQQFLWNGNYLPYDQLAALRELIETAQQYWQVDARLRQSDRSQGDRTDASASTTVGQFIQLLRGGTITADPYPVRPLGAVNQAVTLSTIFQYCSSRRAHRWQLWLDVGSERWLTGGEGLFGAPLFLKSWSGRAWTEADTLEMLEQRLRRVLLDLLGRTGERVTLCHSELAVNGQEQAGMLLALVNAAGAIGT